MKILTAAEMGEADRRTAEEFNIPLASLMEQAGEAVAHFCLRRYPLALSITVLCGRGNNGGDGLVAARCLAAAGRKVHVLLTNPESDFKSESAVAMGRLRADASSVMVETLAKDTAEAQMDAALISAELIIDALLGTGFKPPLRGRAVELRDKLAEMATPVVAVDLPSGWDADSLALRAETAFRADAVVTFTAPKLAHVFGSMTSGPVVVAGIGSPDAAVVSAERLSWTGSSKQLAEQPRSVDANKGTFGHVLIVGGSYGKAGAPSMAALAALRTGAGLVTAAVPKSIVNTVARVAPELMIESLTEGERGAVSFKNLDAARLESLLKKMTVLALGPGLSTQGDAPEFARHLVQKTTLPVVIDADALNAFEKRASLLDGSNRTMVLTPHPGEMARLAGLTVKQVEADRIGLARKFATEHKLTLVLKGWRTLIAHPDGSVAVNTTGSPAMAKGGSGDILTGIVAAMLAQFPNDVARAVETAVYLHGLAGELAARSMDEHTVLATDTVTYLSEAFRYRVKDKDGMTWISGLQG